MPNTLWNTAVALIIGSLLIADIAWLTGGEVSRQQGFFGPAKSFKAWSGIIFFTSFALAAFIAYRANKGVQSSAKAGITAPSKMVDHGFWLTERLPFNEGDYARWAGAGFAVAVVATLIGVAFDHPGQPNSTIETIAAAVMIAALQLCTICLVLRWELRYK